MKRDIINSKPIAGRFFPMSVSEVIEEIKELSFQVHDYDAQIPLMFQNCKYEPALGHQLASFCRRGYLAVFSLPESVAKGTASKSLIKALEEFSQIDRKTRKATKDEQFIIYRAYLGELSVLSITEDIINAGTRWYLLYKKVAQVSKSDNLKHHETLLQKYQIV